MKIEVTTHIEIPDEWTTLFDGLTTSKSIISALKSTGITEEITGAADTIINAKII